jgi:tetratricopeptide (TPR) repeat protein
MGAERPDDPFLLFYVDRTYQVPGRTAEALALLRRSLEVGGPAALTAPRAFALLLGGQRRLGRVEEAWALCRQGRTHHPDDPERLNEEALLCHARGDLAGAERCLVRLLEGRVPALPALGVDPGLWGYRTRYKLGVLYRERGKPAEAEAQWHAALAERPDHAEAWLALADLWLEQGRTAELDHAATRLEGDPRRATEGALLRAASYLARERFVAARRLLEARLRAEPHSVWLRLALGAALAQEGRDLPAAERLLREVLATIAADQHRECTAAGGRAVAPRGAGAGPGE